MKKEKHKSKNKLVKANIPAATDVSTSATVLSINKLVTLLALLCAAFAFILYLNTLGHGFVGDDDTVIAKNTITTNGVSAIPEIFTTAYRKGFWDRKESLYRPLSKALFAVEWQFSPENPFLFHLMNILLFALTVFVLMKTLALFIPGTMGILIAFVTSLLYAAHPVHTEVVANVKSCDEILCLLFSLIALYFLFSYLKGKRIILLFSALFIFFLSLLSKENSIAMLGIFPLAIFFFSDTTLMKTIAYALMFFGAAFLYLLLRINALGSLSNFTEIQLINNSLVETNDATIHFATAVYILGKYLLLNLFPHPLTWDYSFRTIPLQKLSDVGFIISFFVYIGLLVYAITGIRKKSPAAFGVWFYLIMMALVSNIFILIESTMAERFLYFSSVGICFALAVFWVQFRTNESSMAYSSVKNFITGNKKVLYPLAVILLLFSFKTVARNFQWKDNFTMLSYDVKSSPESARIRYAYGSALLFEKGISEKNTKVRKEYVTKAISELEKGVSILPTYAEAMYHLLIAYREIEDYPNAIRNWEGAQALKKNTKEEFFVAAAISYGSLKQFDKAIATLIDASEKYPGSKDVYNNLGLYLLEKGSPDSSITYLQKAVAIDSAFYSAWFNLGNSYARKNDFQNAVRCFTRSAEINPLNEDAWNNVGNSYAAMKDYSNALKNFQKALDQNPGNPKALNNMGVTYYMLGDTANANRFLKQVHPQ
ncbi:MAG: tetratricopeptide repeat protein [Bacteroidia bacterium]|nr:tetratricopeptide repeat protein [Bacteroidia bacterium]